MGHRHRQCNGNAKQTLLRANAVCWRASWRPCNTCWRWRTNSLYRQSSTWRRLNAIKENCSCIRHSCSTNWVSCNRKTSRFSACTRTLWKSFRGSTPKKRRSFQLQLTHWQSCWRKGGGRQTNWDRNNWIRISRWSIFRTKTEGERRNWRWNAELQNCRNRICKTSFIKRNGSSQIHLREKKFTICMIR